MKKIIALLCITLAFSFCLFSKTKKSPHIIVKGENISISYGQPSKRERIIFGELVPYGKVWRTGANEATEITIEKDCLFGGTQIKAGTYTLFTIPEKNEWTVVLNVKLGQWGAYDYDKIKDKDVLKITVPSKQLEQIVEKMTFTIEKNTIKLEWEQTEINIPITFN